MTALTLTLDLGTEPAPEVSAQAAEVLAEESVPPAFGVLNVQQLHHVPR